MNKRVATFDIETNGLLPDVTKVWCIVVKDHSDGSSRVFDTNSINNALNYLNSFDVLIGHNCIAYDFPVLRKLYGWEYKGIKVDTLIMSRTQRQNRKHPDPNSKSGPHSVEAWGLRLGRKKVQNNVWDVYNPIILERCLEDVEIQYEIYHALLQEGHGEGWTNAHKLNNKLFDLLQQQEEYGWTIDLDKLEDNIRLLNKWIDKINQCIGPKLPYICEPLETKKAGEYNYVKKPFKADGGYSKTVSEYYINDTNNIIGPFSRITFRKVDLDSNKEVKEYLLKQGWEPSEWNEDDEGNKRSAKFSKDDEFVGIVGGLGKLIAKRIQCRQRLSVLQGWRENIRPDGRISTKVSGIATTGRLRHSVVVNIPSPHSNAFFAKQMRQIFIAKKGWDLVGVDSKGNQVRQLAARMNDDEFIKAVLYGNADDGTDLHSLNQRRSGAESRSKAKNFFYGFLYGAGARKIATTIGISVLASKSLIERYLSELPLLKQLISDLTKEWKATARRFYDKETGQYKYFNGYIKGIDGRPILVDSEHKVLCYTLQSDEAIQMAVAYVMFHKWMEKAGYKYKEDWGMLIWMHDEFQFECLPEITKHCAELACESIAWAGRYLNISCPHEGESKVGHNWYETH